VSITLDGPLQPDVGIISLAKERTLRQLQEVNERLVDRIAELEKERHGLTVGKITEHGLRCGALHPHVVVDEHAPVVECAVCKERLDPLVVLRQYAKQEKHFMWNLRSLRDEKAKLAAEVEALKKERSNVRAQVKRAQEKLP
jgi:cell division protein FtsB